MLPLQQHRWDSHHRCARNGLRSCGLCRGRVQTALAVQQQQQTTPSSCSKAQSHISTDAGADVAALPLACALTLLQILDAAAPSHAAAASMPTKRQQQQHPAAQQLMHRHMQLLQLPSAPCLTAPDAAAKPPAASLAAAEAAELDPLSSTSGPGGLPAVYGQLPPLPSSFPDLPKQQQPLLYQEVLPNGLRVTLLEDREVPLIRGSLLMPGGQVSTCYRSVVDQCCDVLYHYGMAQA